MKLSLIFASTDNDVISDNADVNWLLPADLKRFRRVTLGHSVIMGRKTFEKIGKPLEGRKNIVLTRQKDYHADGITVVHSDKEAVAAAEGEEAFVMGGGEVYKLFEDLADKAYRTRVRTTVKGEIEFSLHPSQWQLVEVEGYKADQENPFDYTFLTYIK